MRSGRWPAPYDIVGSASVSPFLDGFCPLMLASNVGEEVMRMHNKRCDGSTPRAIRDSLEVNVS